MLLGGVCLVVLGMEEVFWVGLAARHELPGMMLLLTLMLQGRCCSGEELIKTCNVLPQGLACHTGPGLIALLRSEQQHLYLPTLALLAF